MKLMISLILLFFLKTECKWSVEQAAAYYNNFTTDQPIIGNNFITSTCSNQLEFWQESTFDVETISKELSLAQEIGFSSVRVFLHNLAYLSDKEGFISRIEQYLKIADEKDISTMFVFFDDCWNNNGSIGVQPDPVKGVHNSQWLQSPQRDYGDENLEEYVKTILERFKNDKRIFMWDLYNEAGNSGKLATSIPLLEKVFKWARDVNPSQPLTSPIWINNQFLKDSILKNSDIITIHNYGILDDVRNEIEELEKISGNRPIVVSEYMARDMNCYIQTHLPYFVEKNIGAYNWGFVTGKTQTRYPWLCTLSNPCKNEPVVWHHDILKEDYTPYDKTETDLIKKLSKL